MTPLELMLSGEKRPSELFGAGYDGPPKPSDLSTALYLGAFMAALGTLGWVIFFC